MTPGVIRTVNGDIPADRLGVCYAHEHVLVAGGALGYADPQFLIDDPERACAEIAAAKDAGLASMVDATPCAFGRDVVALSRIAQRTGIAIIAATGVHLASSYVGRHWVTRYSEAELEALFLADIVDGIDRHDYVGPVVERTDHRAGVIKAASTGREMSGVERSIFAAAARASLRTGVPILTHTDGPRAGHAQLDFLVGAGVPAHRVVLSHLDRIAEGVAIAELAAAGAYAAFDQAPRDPEPTLRLILSLLEAGLGDRILLGMDMGRRGYWRAYGGGPGLAFLLDTFSDRLRDAGVSDADLRRIFVDNPAQAFAMDVDPASREARRSQPAHRAIVS